MFQKADDDLMPLVDLLIQRLTYVLNQVPTIAEDILSNMGSNVSLIFFFLIFIKISN